jgi:uncharacterized secreted repeat protein (TIGR03808 family)
MGNAWHFESALESGSEWHITTGLTGLNRRKLILAAGTGFAALSPPGLRSAFAMPMRHAMDFGIVPDAGTDQSRLVARAISETALRGETLYFPPGDYAFRTVALPSGASLAGAPGRSRLVASGPGPLLTAQDATHLSLDGLVLDGRLQSSDGLVTLDQCRNLSLKNCHFTATGGTLLLLNGASGEISGCRFDHALEAAIFSTDGEGLTVSDNTISDVGDNGVMIWRSVPGEDRSILRDNRINRIDYRSGGTGQNGNGINIFRANRVLVRGNRVEDCAYSAVRINSGSNCQILGNTATRVGETALYVEFVYTGAVVANNVVDGAGTGISITNFNDGGRLSSVAGNLVRNLHPRRIGVGGVDSTGTGISVEADVSVTGNVVEAAPFVGIATGYGYAQRNVMVSANTVRACGVGVGVSVAMGAGTVTVRDNVIARSDVAAIAGFDHDELVTGELADADTGLYPFLDLAGNRVGA